ncbi:MAG: dihydrodipicolinate synthase family protein [Planctomycetes bacterium]|nr:dihydrodipicolinate synthase family protein [Planctomycetota bacterium]
MPHKLFHGVLTAVTTPFDDALAVDVSTLAQHVRWQLEQGCHGVIPLGSLGEGQVLEEPEKRAVLRTCVDVAGTKPVVAGIGALSTRAAVRLAEAAAEVGCRGLMVLPPYAHRGPLREAVAHVAAVFAAVPLPCMLYNNPPAYGADFTPDVVAELAAQHANLVALKESSGDARRVTAVRALCGDRLAVLVGLDDMLLEGVAAGAVGWVAGLVNAFPRESAQLFALARAGRTDAARALYDWFLPLLRLDTLPDFVQRIKLVQEAVGHGHHRVRPPRLPLDDASRRATFVVLERALATRPEVGA